MDRNYLAPGTGRDVALAADQDRRIGDAPLARHSRACLIRVSTQEYTGILASVRAERVVLPAAQAARTRRDVQPRNARITGVLNEASIVVSLAGSVPATYL